MSVDFTSTGKPTTHGTRTNYNRGCRCDECFEVQSAYNRESQIRLAEEFKAGLREITHGTVSSYVHYRCRCEPCREAHRTEWNRQCRNRVKEVETGERRIEHGTSNAYTNYKCRCDRCKEAQTLYLQKYRQRKREEGKK